jgi:post-segregation antitoxin (ccd killing protein)
MIDHDPERASLAPGDGELAWLQRELAEAHKTIRSLLRQLSKEQARHAETARAYNLTVANLVEATRQNALLEHERDTWKARAEGRPAPFTLDKLTLTAEEIGAIRKAIARLHHPDTGGDVERMKLWNAALDPLEP